MTMTEFRLLAEYWRDHPPAHLLLGGRVNRPAAKPDLARLLGADPGKAGAQAMQFQ